MNNIKNEYALFIIKPDGVANGILEEFKNLCEKKNVTIIHTRVKKIERSDVNLLFNSGFDIIKYSNYLTSGPVIAGLCKGNNVFNIIKKIKYCIREKYGVSNSMKNLLHTAEPGLEYSREFNYFFDDLSPQTYTLGCDLCVKIDTIDDLYYIEHNTNLIFIGVLLNSNTLMESNPLNYTKGIYCIKKKYKLAGYVLPLIIYSFDCEYLSFLMTHTISIDELVLQNNRRIVISIDFINYSNYEKPYIIDMLGFIKNNGIDTIWLYDPRTDYNTLNIIEFWGCTKNKMSYTGGSNGICPIGSFSIDFNNIFRSILK